MTFQCFALRNAVGFILGNFTKNVNIYSIHTQEFSDLSKVVARGMLNLEKKAFWTVKIGKNRTGLPF